MTNGDSLSEPCVLGESSSSLESWIRTSSRERLGSCHSRGGRTRAQKAGKTARDPLTLRLVWRLDGETHRGEYVGRGARGSSFHAARMWIHELGAAVVDEGKARLVAVRLGVSFDEELQAPKADAVAWPQLEVTGTIHLTLGADRDEDERSPLPGAPTVNGQYRGYRMPASVDHQNTLVKVESTLR